MRSMSHGHTMESVAPVSDTDTCTTCIDTVNRIYDTIRDLNIERCKIDMHETQTHEIFLFSSDSKFFNFDLIQPKIEKEKNIFLS